MGRVDSIRWHWVPITLPYINVSSLRIELLRLFFKVIVPFISRIDTHRLNTANDPIQPPPRHIRQRLLDRPHRHGSPSSIQGQIQLQASSQPCLQPKPIDAGEFSPVGLIVAFGGYESSARSGLYIDKCTVFKINAPAYPKGLRITIPKTLVGPTTHHPP